MTRAKKSTTRELAQNKFEALVDAALKVSPEGLSGKNRATVVPEPGTEGKEVADDQ